MARPYSFTFSIFLIFFGLINPAICTPKCSPIKANDKDLLQFALNLEFMEADWFLYGAFGKGLDYFAPYLTKGGPPPIGAMKANLNPLTNRVMGEFGFQEVGHLRAIITTVGGFPRPLYNLSRSVFADAFDKAVGYKLHPPFNPYANSLNFYLASYFIPYVGLNGYVGTIPILSNSTIRGLAGSLLGVESGQDAHIRTRLYERRNEKVEPYELTVAEATAAISKLRNRLGRCGIKDEGIIVPRQLGAENRTTSNVLSADYNSLSYARTPQEILRIVQGTGCESRPGGFLPRGGNGRIAKELLNDRSDCRFRE